MTITDELVEQYGLTMTPKNVSCVLSCHVTHVRAMCASGELPAVRIGGRWRIPTVKLAAMLEGDN